MNENGFESNEMHNFTDAARKSVSNIIFAKCDTTKRNKTKWSPKCDYAWNWLISSMGLTNRTAPHTRLLQSINASSQLRVEFEGQLIWNMHTNCRFSITFECATNIHRRDHFQCHFETSWTNLTVIFSIDLCNMSHLMIQRVDFILW